MNNPFLKHILFIAGLVLLSQQGITQSIMAQRKAVPRYEIDAKRTGTDVSSDDALPRSREFKRIDSTYYVGWMYEGVYKYNHAADLLGYKNAAQPLERALNLMERDYRKELSTRTGDIMTFINMYQRHVDYTLIAYHLVNCYSNMDEPMQVYNLLRRVLKFNLQRDWYMDAYNYLAWTVHRNRFYTSEKYPFLKNSIEENEALAHKYLDSGMRRIAINKRLNGQIFLPGYEEQEKLSVYHYKAILHSYALNIDSAKRYYDLMRNTFIFPHNNYATFNMIVGNFRTAEQEYKEAVQQDAGDKRLKEWAYYTSILDIYKGQPKQGGALLRDMIKSNGSSPGFGWYNIALARCMRYDGQIEESERYAQKASEFKELHIGTTLGQSHYDFSLQLVGLMNKMAEIEQESFEHRNWWYNPKVLMKMASLKTEKYMQQFLIINQFAQNPERDGVVYKLFSTESTVGWDEIWYLIKDFSTQFFVNKFEKELRTDERRHVRKYYQLFVAKLKMEQDKYDEAQKMLDDILRSPDIDEEYEKLFLARVYEAQAICAKERDDNIAYNDWMYRLYVTYPQLLPYSGLQMNMKLHVSGSANNEIVERLKDCNINWVSNSAVPAPHAYIRFGQEGQKKYVEYYVLDGSGREIVPRELIPTGGAEATAVKLAYRLFGISGKFRYQDTEQERATL